MTIYQVRNKDNLLMFETTDRAQASQEVLLLALLYGDQQFRIAERVTAIQAQTHHSPKIRPVA